MGTSTTDPELVGTFTAPRGDYFSNQYPEPAFIDRDSYLRYRQDWKTKYSALSVELRQTWSPGGSARATVLLEELEDAKVKAAHQMGKPRPRRYNHTYNSFARDICGVQVRNSQGKKDGVAIYPPQPQAAAPAAE